MAPTLPDVAQALKDTGFLSQEQLAAYFGITRDALPPERWFLWYRGALWDARRFNKGSHRRHAELRAEVYCRLWPAIQSWTTHWTVDDAFRPDALLTVEQRGGTIALEVDTGSESADDWRDKLARYHTAPESCRMLVAAEGKSVRLANLARLLAQESPVPWLVIPWNAIQADMDWPWHEAAVHVPAPQGLPHGRQTRYVLDRCPIPAAEALEGLAQQRFLKRAVERVHGQDIVYLMRR